MSPTGFPNAMLLARLAETYATLPGQWPFTGGILGVVTADGTAQHLPFGRDFDGRAITARTPFLIGSISKFFTGLMISALMGEGRLTPDQTAASILPWLAIGSRHPEPTLRHLLHHTAGLVKGADDPPDEMAQVFSLRDSRTASAPGSFFHYSTSATTSSALSSPPLPAGMRRNTPRPRFSVRSAWWTGAHGSTAPSAPASPPAASRPATTFPGAPAWRWPPHPGSKPKAGTAASPPPAAT